MCPRTATSVLGPTSALIPACTVSGAEESPSPGPEGIRVNAVAAGWMTGEWMEDQLGENYDRLMGRRARLTRCGKRK